MSEINLDHIIEFAKTQNIEIQNYSDPAIKASPNKYIYSVIDNNIIGCNPERFYLQVSPLSLTLVAMKNGSDMTFKQEWRAFLMNKDISFADAILEEIKHNKSVINTTRYKLSSVENQSVREEKLEDLIPIENEVYQFLDGFVAQYYN